MTQLREAVDALVAVATRAGIAADQARDEGLVFAAAMLIVGSILFSRMK